MKNLKRSILAMLLVVVLIASSIVPVSAAGNQPSKYSTTNNSGTRHVVCTTLDGTSAASYYTGSYTYDRLEDLSASSLVTTLRGLMTSTHNYKSSYANCRDYANRTDCENGSGTNIITIYTSYSSSHSEYNGGNGWNREHVWPKSLGGFNQDGAGADLHHIRPSENRTNSNRGNLKYGNVNGGSTSTGNLSGLVGGNYSGYFEPLDNVKGDVARICLYVYVRYGTEYSQCSNILNVFQSVDVLLEWCALDPVDTWEMGRNEVVGAIQGNRNVFIDYPELAWLIFGKAIPSNMVTPSGEAMGESGDGGDVGGDPSCTHATTEIRNKTEATCTTTGYTGDTYCKSCGTKISSGTTVNAKGHTWSDWTVDVGGTEKVRSCSVCNATETEPAEVCSHGFTTFTGKLAPTCGSNGYSGDTKCAKCNAILVKGQVIPASGEHSWGDMVVTNEPTDEHFGSGTHTCSVCGRTKTTVISNYTAEEELIATFSWNAVYTLLCTYLTKQ